MSSSLWPFTCDGQTYHEPVFISANRYTINDQDFLSMIQKQPTLWSHIIKNKDLLSHSLQQYIHGISEPFSSELSKGTIARVKVAGTEWQSMENHRYVSLELIHCANYEHYTLPFHDPYHQYGFFFIDINKSIQEKQVVLYWQDDKEPDGSYEEHIWCSMEDIDIIYAAGDNHGDKDRIIGFKDAQIRYLKTLSNERLDELEASSSEVLKVMICRLRGKIRPGYYGKIVSCQGIISSSSWDTLVDKVRDIIRIDHEYSNNKNIISYKLTRNQLVRRLKINPVLILRIYDVLGKEMKIARNLKQFELYKGTISSYRGEVNELSKTLLNKYKKKRVLDQLCGFNGIRIVHNKNTKTIRLITNIYTSTFDEHKIENENEAIPIKQTMGRKMNW